MHADARHLLPACLLLPAVFSFATAPVTAQPASSGPGGACLACHKNIVESYRKTAMAQSSGRVGTGGLQEAFNAFTDESTGTGYRVESGYRVSYERPATGLNGGELLQWFIGSGRLGRSYASEKDGFLFQSPVSYYTAAGKWGLSPGFQSFGYVESARPIEEACLQCHASDVRKAAGTQNRYADPPFTGGIACERCHGPAVEHARSGGKARVVNPARLESGRRDSVCLQCHLTGAARVSRKPPGAPPYRPGDRLSDHLAVFVRTAATGTRAATDHAEQLSRSRCQQAAGAKLWCGTCHDAHSEPAATARLDFYRKSCLGCHEESACREPIGSRRRASDDCAGCHMPKGASREGEHIVYTDHTIRRPGAPAAATMEIRPFWPEAVTRRDMALAYADLGQRDRSLRGQARDLLEEEAARPQADAKVLVQLGQICDATGDSARAVDLYLRALKADPAQPAAAANLAIYHAREGRLDEAIRLWAAVFEKNPGLSGPGVNLAKAHWMRGDAGQAQAVLARLKRFHPDHPAVRALTQELAGRR
jgi:hypothetical protein